MTDSETPLSSARNFIQKHLFAILATSTVLLIPCFWQRRLEAGDLGSHTYTAWLAQLISQGKAPGLYTVWKFTNVLFDLLLLYFTRAFGFALGPKLAVALCVLVFFWGVFSLIAVASERHPWALAPWIAMLSYGFVFNMGFFNYYLSIGLACWVLASFWRAGTPRGWLLGVIFFPFAILAHPMGTLWCLCLLLYILARRKFAGCFGLLIPASVLALVGVLHWFFLHTERMRVAWPEQPFYFWTGFDQVVLYSARFRWISYACIAMMLIWIAFELIRRHTAASPPNSRWRLPAEIYLLSTLSIWLLPQDLRPDPNGAWMGVLVARLTVVAAIFGLATLSCLRPNRAITAAMALTAAFYFVFLFQETAAVNRMELNAENIVSKLPFGTLVIPTIPAADNRSPFVGHVVDSACIQRCFTYSNYEVASQLFRVRAHPDSPIAVDTEGKSEKMEAGDYVVKPSDPPFVNVYRCGGNDPAALCSRVLAPGEPTGLPDDESDDDSDSDQQP
jgi:hypothetical protein